MNPKEEDTEEYKQILAEIKDIEQTIQRTKDSIFRYYTLKRTSDVFNNESDDEDSVVNISYPDIKLDFSFYKKFSEIKCKNDESLITILLPFNGETRFGFNLEKTGLGKWSFQKAQLPHSIDLDYFKEELSQLSLEKIPEFIEKIQRNVYSYYIREEHVQKLKETMDSRILLYHCLRYGEVELKFKVSNEETKIRYSVTLLLNFDLLSVLPYKITCKIINDNEEHEMEKFFNNHFQLFKNLDLISAYKKCFVKVDKYNFFV